jgi:hypothetical protein
VEVLSERVDEVEQRLDRDRLVGAMSKHGSGGQAVMVAAAGSGRVDVALFDELTEDAVCCAFGDADLFGDGPQPRVGVPGNVEKGLEMVREELPVLSSIT